MTNKFHSGLLAMNCPRSCTWYRIWISASQLFSFLKKTHVLYNFNKNNVASTVEPNLFIYSWIWTRSFNPTKHSIVLAIFILAHFLLLFINSSQNEIIQFTCRKFQFARQPVQSICENYYREHYIELIGKIIIEINITTFY